MKKDNSENSLRPDLLRKIIRPSEPVLQNEEKEAMWKAIEQKTRQRPQQHIRPWAWYAAASFLIITIGSWMLFQQVSRANPYARMAELVNVDTLHHICLYIDQQQVVLGEQVEVICHAASNQVEIRTSGNNSFRLSAPQQKETYLQLAVPAGKKAQVVLADRSRITVREQSKFSFPLQLADDTRKVHLEGEAYMQIARNAAKRFITETTNINLAVLGTEFLISAYPNQAEQSVLLVSGSVEISPLQGKKQILTPSQRYVYNTATQKTALVSHVNPALHLSWKEEMLLMKNEPLSNVLKNIESIYHIQFNYDWNELAHIHLNGKLDITVPLDILLERLSKIAPIKLDKQQRNITLRKNP